MGDTLTLRKLNMPALQTGGRNAAKAVREKKIKEYYANPNTCLNCNKVIEMKNGQKLNYVNC